MLGARYNESVKAAEELTKDYRLHPGDGVLEKGHSGHQRSNTLDPRYANHGDASRMLRRTAR